MALLCRVSAPIFLEKFSIMNRFFFVFLSLFVACFSAQATPTSAVRIIVPFAPGGTTDIVARMIARPLSARLGAVVSVENIAGGGGTVGTEKIAKALPDGLTLGIATASGFAAGPASKAGVGYDPLTDFVPITNIAFTPNVIAVHPSFPARNFSEFLDVLRKNPGKYKYATAGQGSVGHLQMEQFKALTGIDITHQPYPGAAPALQAVLSGQADILFDQIPSSRQAIVFGKLRGMAIAAPKRLPMPLDTLPTLGELGYEPANRVAFYGLIAPSGLSRGMQLKLHEAMENILTGDFGMRRKLEDAGAAVAMGTPENFAVTLRDELANAKAIVLKQGIKLN
jgi:tripartite-type tricarboxylate transporter receptor subunit TctC